MQLICDVLVHDSKSSACLNDEQRSMLTSFSHKGASVPQHRGKRYLNDRHGLYIVLSLLEFPPFPNAVFCLVSLYQVISD